MQTMVSTGGGEASCSAGSSDVLLPGVKAGPWVIEHELGRGGMGAVYAVVHEAIGKRAALKVVHAHLLVTGFNGDRMMLEAKVVNQVGHPNIVDIFETGKLADGRPYIVMERLAGHALSVRSCECKLPPDLVIAILLQVCDALIAAHAAGIVHRDLKLDNVFLVDNPEDPATPKVKLLDWGIAKVISHEAKHTKHTVEGQLVGTPQYLAPEQARGQAVSPQTDVYSLGVMAYELFLEHPPFQAETAAEVIAMHLRAPPPPPCSLWPGVPPPLHDLLLAMLAKLPHQRPTVLEVARRLEAVRDDIERRRHASASSHHPIVTPIEARVPASVIPPANGASIGHSARWARRKRWCYTIGAFALAAGAMLLLRYPFFGEDATAAAGADDPTMAPPIADALVRGATRPAPRPTVPDLERPSPSKTAMTAIEAAAVPAQSPRHPTPAGARARLPSAAPVPAAGTTPPRSTASRPTPASKASVAPHRGIKVDPDGTLDPYRPYR
jgi:serine/threonine-protein kinase